MVSFSTGVGGADLDLDVLGGAFADHEIVGAAHVIDDALVEFIAGDADAAAKNDAAERDDGDLGGAAADVDDHVAGRFLHGQADADRRGHRFLHEIDVARAGVDGRILDRALFDFGDAGGHGDDDARTALPAAAVADLVDEGLEHRLGDFEIGDDAILHRTDGDDVAGRAAEHALGFVADGQDAFGTGFDGDDGGFAQDDAAIADIDEGVGRAEIDADVVGEKAGEKVHFKCSCGKKFVS